MILKCTLYCSGVHKPTVQALVHGTESWRVLQVTSTIKKQSDTEIFTLKKKVRYRDINSPKDIEMYYW